MKSSSALALVTPVLLYSCLEVDAFATPGILGPPKRCRPGAEAARYQHEVPHKYDARLQLQSAYPKHVSRNRSNSVGALPLSGSSTALASFTVVASAVDTFYRTSPLLAAFVTCGANGSAADIVAQKRASIAAKAGLSEIRSAPIEKRRILAFLLYGGLYQGIAQEFLYNRFLPKLFGTGTAPSAVIGKVLFDMLVLTPILCLPVAYIVKALVYQRPLSEAWKHYTHDVREEGLLKKCWSLWGPVQCLTFSIVPEHFRVSFVSSVSFFWLIVLSTISSGKSV